MLLSDLFSQLRVGELSQMSMGGFDDAVGIAECDYPKIIPHVNLGMTELYKRFPLKENQLIIQEHDEINLYTLTSEHAESNIESTSTKYIMDSIEYPFKDDIIRIERVLNEEGETLFLNDKNQIYSVFTPSYNTLQIPLPSSSNATSVVYKAAPTLINIIGLNPFTTELDIPISLLEPLCLFIASRLYSNLNSDGVVTEGNTYLTRFEAACKRISEFNLLNDDNTTNDKLDNNRWV